MNPEEFAKIGELRLTSKMNDFSTFPFKKISTPIPTRDCDQTDYDIF
jgi:hypothetical protein